MSHENAVNAMRILAMAIVDLRVRILLPTFYYTIKGI